MRATPPLPQPTPTDITTADQSEGDSTTALYRAAIGPVNADYYLRHFTRWDSADHAGLSWNWSAALCTLNWMAYRRLWSAALVYAGAVVGLALLVFGIGGLVFQAPASVKWGLLLAFALAAFAMPGLYGNAIFHAQCRKRMAHALRTANTLPEACALLKRQASSRQRLASLSLANAVALGFLVLAYLYFPKAGPLPASPPQAAVELQQLALDRALEAASKPQPSAFAPAATASAPLAAASAPLPADVASAPVLAAAPPPSEPKVDVVEEQPQKTQQVEKAAGKAEIIQAKKAATAQAARAAAPAPAAVPRVVAAKAQQETASVPAKPAPAEARYLVNVGLFADDNNARNAYVKLSDAGLAVFKQEIKTKKGVLTRVRVGPFDTEGEAQTAVEKIRALGLEALVLKP